MHQTLLDTDQYVETVGPLIDDPDVQAALAQRITNSVLAQSDVEARVVAALPPQASFIAPAVATAFEQLVERAALQFVQSDAVEKLWDAANRRAHAQLVALLEGESTTGNVTTDDGAVVVHLGRLVERVQTALETRGVDLSGTASSGTATPKIVLIQSETLESVQGATDLFQTIAYALPVLTLLAFAGAIWLSGNRRRTILRSALGVALAMGLLLVVLGVARDLYLDALPTTVNEDAAASVYDQVLSSLRTLLSVAFIVSLIVAVAAWISGPSRVPVRLRAATIGRHRDRVAT
jgi:hypothetical protein